MSRFVRFAVVATWLVLVGVLVRSQPQRSLPPPVPTAAAAPPVLPVHAGESWMGLYMDEHKIGYSHQWFAPIPGGQRFQQDSLLRLKVMDSVQIVHALVRGETGADYAVRSFEARIDSGVGRFAASGRVEDGALVVRFQLGKEENVERFPLNGPIYLPAAARESFARTPLSTGREAVLSVFDPSAMQYQPMRVVVEGRDSLAIGAREVPAWRVREEFRGMQTVVWFDDDGKVVREKGPLNLTAVRETAEEAVSSGWDRDTAFDVMAAVAVPVRGDVPDARGLAHLEVRLKGIPDVPIPLDARQQEKDGLLLIEREDLDAQPSYRLPAADPELQVHLEATPFLQVRHARVLEASRRALGGESDARRAAERLRRWVYERLDKVPTVSLPNALQVLDMKGGDCNEHAVLYAALARAAGLPARMIAGAVFVDGAFLYHAWNEVWLGNGWVSVDPTYDQMPADATHIKLIEGGPESHDAILRVIGRLSVDVVAAR